ncbi:DoxX family membrane protein [Deinococcus sonorensis]|uniref:DoxX family membrane protein n=2 Tax=Deinococcus sonorensis TaxID=309891 RepID=A0AAU7UBL0_9DEIO
MNILKFAGRAALAAIFVQSGLESVQRPAGRARLVERAGLPEPELLTRINGGLMAGAGAMLAAGLAPRSSALTLAALLLPTTIVGHAYWNAPAEQREGQRIHFLKNLAMLGALLLVVADRDAR